MLKLFFGVLLGYLLFTNPQARQVTADLLRAGGDAFAPSDDCKTLREHFTDLIGGTDEVPADCSVLLLSTRYGSTEVCNPVA